MCMFFSTTRLIVVNIIEKMRRVKISKTSYSYMRDRSSIGIGGTRPFSY